METPLSKAGEKLSGQVLRKVEHKLIELKAKVDDLYVVRNKLADLKAQRIGTFRQIDIYFDVPKGRLKLREVEGNNEAQLVYYERENVAGPKKSDVFILSVQKPIIFKRFLGKVLKTKAVVDKKREIYRYQGTQIHLDMVEGLGTFVEFERKTPADPYALRKNKKVLQRLMEKLGIKPESVEELSYGDLIQK